LLGVSRQRLILLGGVLALSGGLIVFLVLRADDSGTRESHEPDSWGALQERIYRAGGPSPELALEAFALLIGPVPGVEVEEDVSLPPHMSGTGAVRLVLGFWESYTPPQRAAIERMLLQPLERSPWRVRSADSVDPDGKGLHVPNGAKTASVGVRTLVARRTQPSQGDGPALAQDTAPTDRAIRARLREVQEHTRTVLADLRRLLGPLRHRVEWVLSTARLRRSFGWRRSTESWAQPVRRGGGAWVLAHRRGADWTCLIGLGSPDFWEADRELLSTLAHELFHCYQWEVAWDLVLTGPSWLLEGSAEWVGEAYVSGSNLSRQRWSDYQMVRRPLFARSYDAIGFFAQMTEAGFSTWDELIPMLRTGSGDRAFARVSSDIRGQDLLDTWPMSIANNPELGPEWVLKGPGAGHLGGRGFDSPDHQAGGTARFRARRGEQRLVHVWLTDLVDATHPADVITVDVTGNGGLLFGEGNTVHRFGGRFSAVYCWKGSCACPDGSRPPGVRPHPALAGDEIWRFALTGTLQPARAVITGSSLQELCPEESTSANFESCFGRWRLVRLDRPASGNLPAGRSATATVSGGTGTQLTISPPTRQSALYVGSATVDFTDTEPLTIVSREREKSDSRVWTRNTVYKARATGVARGVDIGVGPEARSIHFSPIVPTLASGREVTGHWETKLRWVELVDVGDHWERTGGGGRKQESGGVDKLFPAPSPYPAGPVRYTCEGRSLTLESPSYGPCLFCLRWMFTRADEVGVNLARP
jgi:hypothetical protein